MKVSSKIIILILSLLIFSGCKAISFLYGGMEREKVYYSNDIFCYMYPMHRRENNKSLIISIGGSGCSSALGSKVGGISTGYSTGGLLNLRLSKNYDLLIIEKPNLEPFEDGKDKKEFLQLYTVEDLSSIDAFLIDKFIKNNDCYDDIILFGHSEGGVLAPAIYRKVKSDKISKLVIAGAGGLSQEKQFTILSTRPNSTIQSDFLEKCEEIYANPDSIELFWWGYPYKRWASFLRYKSLDDIQNIDISILLYHGVNDTSVPVESSQIVFNEYNSKGNIFYIEDDGDHGSVFNHLDLIEEWIENH